MDALAEFKAMQKQGWANFGPFEWVTATAAPHLVRFSGVREGDGVLDVGCGTGVVAITARRTGARVTGLDFTPELLARAKENARISGMDVEFIEGDVEKLPFPDASFGVVLSQFGHMFAPRPQLAISEMLRVLKPGGKIAFSTWPPETFTGRMFALLASYLPPFPPGVAVPGEWGDPHAVRERLGKGVKDLVFKRSTMSFPVLSPSHHRAFSELNSGPVIKLVNQVLAGTPKLEMFRREYDALAAQYFDDNFLRQDFLMSMAIKQ